MIYLMAASAFGLLLIWATAPKGPIVLAARPKKTFFTQHRMPFASLYEDVHGQSISMDGRIVAVAKGDSGVRYGIRHGDKVLAEVLDENSRSTLSPGDIVIINSVPKTGKIPYRIRQIVGIDGDQATFEPDSKGELKTRPLNKVFAKVTHVA